jgi:hypothetical protein
MVWRTLAIVMLSRGQNVLVVKRTHLTRLQTRMRVKKDMHSKICATCVFGRAAADAVKPHMCALPCTMYHVPCSVYHLPCPVYLLPSTVYRLPSTVYCLPSTVYRVLCCLATRIRTQQDKSDKQSNVTTARSYSAPLQCFRRPHVIAEEAGQTWCRRQVTSPRLVRRVVSRAGRRTKQRECHKSSALCSLSTWPIKHAITHPTCIYSSH